MIIFTSSLGPVPKTQQVVVDSLDMDISGDTEGTVDFTLVSNTATINFDLACACEET